MAMGLSSIGPYLMFLILLVIIVAVGFLENHLDENAEEEGEFNQNNDMPWIPYHESEEHEPDMEMKFATVPEDETESFSDLGNHINNLSKSEIVHPVEYYASSRGSIFART